MVLLDRVLDVLNQQPVPALGELKEPVKQATKERPTGTKRLPTAVELHEEKIQEEKKMQRKRVKLAAKNPTSQSTTDTSSVKRIKLFVRSPA